jgi:hypothetical protein
MKQAAAELGLHNVMTTSLGHRLGPGPTAVALKQESGTRLDPDQVEFSEMRHRMGGSMTLVERGAAFILTSVFQEGKGRKK